MQKTASAKLALVTGANRGIGFAIAKGLADSGIITLVASRNEEAGSTAAKTIGDAAKAVVLDLSNRATMHEQIASIKNEYGNPDILINNAGILENGSLLDVSTDKFDHSMQVNFTAPFDLIRMLAPAMVENNYGRIVNISSGWGAFSDGLNGPAAYSVSKAALNALTLSFSHALPQSVKINAMCPGWVRTRMGGSSASRSPEQGAATALWLATLDNTGPSGKFFRDKTPINW